MLGEGSSRDRDQRLNLGVQRHRYCRLHVLAHPGRRVLKESTQLRRWGGDPRIKGSEYTQIVSKKVEEIVSKKVEEIVSKKVEEIVSKKVK